jgi:beta-xylosidase
MFSCGEFIITLPIALSQPKKKTQINEDPSISKGGPYYFQESIDRGGLWPSLPIFSSSDLVK